MEPLTQRAFDAGIKVWVVPYPGIWEAKQKRFTDAELAAEVFSAIFHETECELRGSKLGPGHPHFDHYVKHNHEFGRQAQILERFATTPSYDEVTR
jgi:hypothetical protein